jgi:hypothetical protein
MATFKAITVKTRRSSVYGGKCAAPKCGHPMRVGDTCIVFDAGHGVYVQRETYFHRRCLLAMILDTPIEGREVDVAIDRIRNDGSVVLALLGAE